MACFPAIQQLMLSIYALKLVPFVEGIDAIIRKLDDGKATEAQNKLAKEWLEGVYRYWVAEAFPFLPGKPTKEGEGWEQQDELEFSQIVRQTTKRKFTDAGTTELDGRKARKFAVTAEVTLGPSKGDDEGLSFKVEEFKLTGMEYKGTLLLDEKNGREIIHETRKRLTMSVTYGIRGESVDAELISDQTLSVRLLDRKPEPPPEKKPE